VDRKRDCPGWTERIQEACKDGLIVVQGGRMSLTAEGQEIVLNEQIHFLDGLPADPPMRIHVGAIGTGRTVQEDPKLFERLRHLVRTTLGVEMEGAAIGDIAGRFERRAIVIKAVSDHADQDKDDSFRAFACRASAEVLMAFLRKHLDLGRDAGAREQEAGDKDERGRGFRKELAAACSRKQRLVERRLNTDAVDREILRLRRELRAGGQLHEGDALGDGRYVLVRRIGKGGFATVGRRHRTRRARLRRTHELGHERRI
jgi:hypothetical protein